MMKVIYLILHILTKEFKKAVIPAQLDSRVHFHTLRHSFAPNLAQNGANLYAIQKLLGHSNITTTQIHSHLRNKDLINAINKLYNTFSYQHSTKKNSGDRVSFAIQQFEKSKIFYEHKLKEKYGYRT